jgi:glutaminase
VEPPITDVNDENFRLLYAAASGDMGLMKMLQFKHWKVNAYDYDGRAALGLAASEGHLDCVKYLIAHGADPTHIDARGNDALADAERCGSIPVIEYLTGLRR